METILIIIITALISSILTHLFSPWKTFFFDRYSAYCQYSEKLETEDGDIEYLDKKNHKIIITKTFGKTSYINCLYWPPQKLKDRDGKIYYFCSQGKIYNKGIMGKSYKCPFM